MSDQRVQTTCPTCHGRGHIWQTPAQIRERDPEPSYAQNRPVRPTVPEPSRTPARPASEPFYCCMEHGNPPKPRCKAGQCAHCRLLEQRRAESL